MLTIKYNANGQPLWVQTYDAAKSYDAVSALTLDADANVYVAGYVSWTKPKTQSDYATIKYDTNGARQWVATYDGPASGFDEAQAVAVDAARNVYVTGYSDGGTGGVVNYDYATVKVDPSGAQQWAVRYNGPGNNSDVGVALALDAQDHVFVSGWSTGTHGNDVDFATIKYDQAGSAGVAENPHESASARLLTVAPNPFRESTLLSLVLPAGGAVDLSLYDPSGREVAVPIAARLGAGTHSVEMSGSGLVPGVYFYRLRAGGRSETGKLIRRE